MNVLKLVARGNDIGRHFIKKADYPFCTASKTSCSSAPPGQATHELWNTRRRPLHRELGLQVLHLRGKRCHG